MSPRLLRFGSEDENGFRSVSLLLSDKETLRLSLNFAALREHLIKTATDTDRYPDAALARLISIAESLVVKHADTTSHEWLLFLQRDELTEAGLAAVEIFFPELGMRAVEVALLDLCMMAALDNVAQNHKASQMTTADLVKNAMREFTDAAAALLNKRGPRKGKRKTSWEKKYSKSELERKISGMIRQLSNSGEVNRLGRPSEDAVARALGLNGGKALYRLRRHYGDERDWPLCVTQALAHK